VIDASASGDPDQDRRPNRRLTADEHESARRILEITRAEMNNIAVANREPYTEQVRRKAFFGENSDKGGIQQKLRLATPSIVVLAKCSHLLLYLMFNEKGRRIARGAVLLQLCGCGLTKLSMRRPGCCDRERYQLGTLVSCTRWHL